MNENRDRGNGTGTVGREATPTPSTRHGRGKPALNGESLAAYRRVLRDTPPLDLKDEQQHAGSLHEARRAFAGCVRRLPAEVRDAVLDGTARKPARGKIWPLEQIETCYQRLVRQDEEDGDVGLTEIVAEARHHKLSIGTARDALIMGSLRFVPHVAKNFSHPGISFMDLIQEGNLGLLKAVDRFDPKRGYRFSTYAYWWIRQAISKAVAEKSRVIRYPEHALAMLRKLRRVTQDLREELGRYPTSEEIGPRMQIPPKRVEELIATMLNPFPVESFDSDYEEPELLSNLADPATATPLENTLNREAHQGMAAALDRLSLREQKIIRLRFGIDGERARTLEEVGELVDLSRERVRQLLNAALKKMQDDQGRGAEAQPHDPFQVDLLEQHGEARAAWRGDRPRAKARPEGTSRPLSENVTVN